MLDTDAARPLPLISCSGSTYKLALSITVQVEMQIHCGSVTDKTPDIPVCCWPVKSIAVSMFGRTYHASDEMPSVDMTRAISLSM